MFDGLSVECLAAHMLEVESLKWRYEKGRRWINRLRILQKRTTSRSNYAWNVCQEKKGSKGSVL